MAAAEPVSQKRPGTALLTLTPLRPESRHAGLPPAIGRTRAPFLAHLIATAQSWSQTRARRRASDAEAAGAYRPVARPSRGTRLSRSV